MKKIVQIKDILYLSEHKNYLPPILHSPANPLMPHTADVILFDQKPQIGLRLICLVSNFNKKETLDLKLPFALTTRYLTICVTEYWSANVDLKIIVYG